MSYRKVEELLMLPSGFVDILLGEELDSQYYVKQVRSAGAAFRTQRIRKDRTVFAPREELKLAQRRISVLVASLFSPGPIAHAYANDKTIVSNARAHIGAQTMLHIDFKNFFGSIRQQSITRALRSILCETSTADVDLLASICCRAGCLPQGSPASPVLSNLTCVDFDIAIDDLARSNGCTVTRYSDDICFSTADQNFPPAIATISSGRVELGLQLLSLVKAHGFGINWRKVRYEAAPRRLQVTGVVVGEDVSVPRAFRDDIRFSLHRWATLGIDEAARRLGRRISTEVFAQSLRNGIDFIGQVEGRDSSRYGRFMTAFNELSMSERMKAAAS